MFLQIEIYELAVAEDGEERKVVGRMEAPLAGRKMLVVDSILQTGSSLSAARKYLQEMGAEAKTLAQYTTPQTRFNPDYCLGHINHPERLRNLH